MRVDRMPPSFAVESESMRFEMADEVTTLHE